MLRFLLKIILFFLVAIFMVYLFESGKMKKGWNYLFKKANVQKIIDKGENRLKEEIKKRLENKMPDEKGVEKYKEEERKKIEEIIKKYSR